MENDRELLELAAKTLELNLYKADSNDGGGFYLYKDTPAGNKELTAWNPLIDDGDALRLAVELQLGISIPPVVDGRIEVVTFYGPIISIVEHPQNNDRNAATRRAIVRAAAEIGRAMKSDKR